MLKSFARLTAQLVPNPVGRLPYATALAALKRAVPQADVWARNSYISDSFLPGISDLDITVWYEKTPRPAELHQLQHALQLVKRLFPALGEANTYDTTMVPALARYMNPLALERDPRLREKLGLAPRPVTRGERVAFLLRALDSDWQNLVERPELREAKWREHFTHAGIPLGAIDRRQPLLEQAIGAIAHLAAHADERAGLALIARPLTEYYRAPPEIRNLWAFASPRSLQNILPHRFPYLKPYVPIDEPWLRELIAAQLSWEIAGLTSQSLLIEHDEHTIGHVDNLIEFLDFVPEAEPLRPGMLELRERFARGGGSDA